jgi:hypothetical protein
MLYFPFFPPSSLRAFVPSSIFICLFIYSFYFLFCSDEYQFQDHQAAQQQLQPPPAAAPALESEVSEGDEEHLGGDAQHGRQRKRHTEEMIGQRQPKRRRVGQSRTAPSLSPPMVLSSTDLQSGTGLPVALMPSAAVASSSAGGLPDAVKAEAGVTVGDLARQVQQLRAEVHVLRQELARASAVAGPGPRSRSV